MIKKIVVIGDIHVQGFYGFPGMECYVASNTCIEDYDSAGLCILPRTISKDDYILLVFGNTDIFRYIPDMISEMENPSREDVDSIISSKAESYMSLVLKLKAAGYENIIVMGPMASCAEPGSFSPEDDPIASSQFRNSLALDFNLSLEDKCKELGIPFVSIFLNLVYNDFTADREKFLPDLVMVKPQYQMKHFLEQLAYYYIFLEKDNGISEEALSM